MKIIKMGFTNFRGSFDLENGPVWTSGTIGPIDNMLADIHEKFSKKYVHQKFMDYNTRKSTKRGVYVFWICLPFKMGNFGRQGQLASYITS